MTGWEQGAIKVADIGHLYAPKEVHIKWSERLEEEMWLQGDVEKQRDMKGPTLMPAACWRVAASPLPGAACAADRGQAGRQAHALVRARVRVSSP